MSFGWGIPGHWRWVTLGEIGHIVGGATPDTKVAAFWGGDIPWLTPKDMSVHSGKLIARGARNLTSEGFDASSTRMVPAGTVLFTSRAPIGYAAIAANPLCTNQGFKSLVPGAEVESDFVYWYLLFATPSIREMASGTTFLEISTKGMMRVPIPIPPLEEQRAIVAAIEERLARLDVARDQVEAAARRGRRYLQAVRQRALEGKLLDTTAPNDAGAGLPDGWRRVRIADLASVTSGSTPKAGDVRYYADGEVPWVTSGDLSSGVVHSARQFVTNEAVRDYRLKLHPPGTLLVAMYGEGKTRGKCAHLTIAATTNQACAAITITEPSSVMGAWLKLFFDASYEANRRLASGGVQPNLSGQLIKAMSVPLPPLEEQEAIVAQLDRQATVIASVLATCGATVGKTTALRRAILHAAFTGRLVDSAGGTQDAQEWNSSDSPQEVPA